MEKNMFQWFLSSHKSGDNREPNAHEPKAPDCSQRIPCVMWPPGKEETHKTSSRTCEGLAGFQR